MSNVVDNAGASGGTGAGTARPPLVDATERDAIRTQLDDNLLVEAAAGTGKTTELVNRIIAVLREDRASVDTIVAVTFTEKAAGELKLRLRAELEHARRGVDPASDARTRLEEALARLEEARVSTIHGFCADLLRERPVEARVDPQFEVLTEPEAERLYRDAFELWLQEQLEAPPPGVRRALRRHTRGPFDEGTIDRLRWAGWTLVNWRDFPAAWRRDPFDREARLDECVTDLHGLADLTRECMKPGSDNLHGDTAPLRRLSDAIRTTEGVRPRDHDRLEAELTDLRGWRLRNPRKGRGKAYGRGVAREDVLEAHTAFFELLDRFTRDANADLAAFLKPELAGAAERYEFLKHRSGRLDFVDLLLRARDLIRDSAEVRDAFQKRITHIFIDEFQDTDPLQAEILLLLAADDPSVSDWRQVHPTPGKLFLVADPKQSIYRFRRADVGTYIEVKDILKERGAAHIHLTTSFRAVPTLQRAVNRAFPRLMTGDRESLQAEYVPLNPSREDHPDQPALVALPVPRPYGYRGVTKSAIESSLPDAVGAFVAWLLHESGWRVTERERPGEPVPVSARHVCLLFRRFDSVYAPEVTRPYIRALEARGVRHLLVGGRSFHAREEVETVRTALAAIEWPDDELSVFATLRGSLLAIGDEELLEYHHRFGRLHPFRIPDRPVPPHLQPITQSLELLQELHRKRNRRPTAETISLLLEATRAHAGLVLRPSGQQALANVLHVAEQARTYEGTGGLSFRGFVERLQEDAANQKTAEAPILEEGSDGVRVMTVHKAKGLEFPVVVLADMTANLTLPTASRWIDPEQRLCALKLSGWAPVELWDNQRREIARDAAEGVRLAYVAATRARDLLVVPAIGEKPFPDGWAAPLNHAIYPTAGRRDEARPAPGCPRFGEHSLIQRAQDVGFEVDTVKPGLHVFDETDDELQLVELEGPGSGGDESASTAAGDQSGSETAADRGYGVVWWDPNALRLGVEPLLGIRREDLIAEPDDPAIVQSDRERYEEWRSARADTIERGEAPSIRVRTATQHVEAHDEDASAVEVVELEREAGRPGGARFGTLVHAVLASVPLDAKRGTVEKTAELQARILGAPPEEQTAAAHVARSVLAHPLLKRARRAAGKGECRREAPLTLREADGLLIDGVVDLAFREDAAWTVIDFKTDQELEADLPVYKRQVALYARAIAEATGKRATAVLMAV